MRGIVPSQNTAIQSVCFDEAGGWMYIQQIIQDKVQLPGEPAPVPYATRLAHGDIAVNRMTLQGQFSSVMYVRGAGHGVSAAVNPDGLLWLDADSSGSGFARALSLTPFVPNAVFDSLNLNIFRPFGPPGGSHGLSCAIDIDHQLFAIHRTFPDPGNGRRYYLYNLYDVGVGNFNNVLATVDQPANQPPNTPGAIGTFQGFTTYGGFVYSLEGTATAFNTIISRLNWETGVTEQAVNTQVMSDLKIREPEGLTVYRNDVNDPTSRQLVFGFSSGTDNAKVYNLSYIPVTKPIATAGTFGRRGYGQGGYGQ